jgi:NADPH2:quinone reductase
VQADVVFDPVGGALFDQAFRAVAPAGCWLVIGFAGGASPAPAANRLLLREAELIGVRAGEQGRRNPAAGVEQEKALRDWLVSRPSIRSEGRPRLGAVYRLDQAGAALRCMADRMATGKIVLRVG